MRTHPTSTTLEGFLATRLSWEQMKSVVFHLLRGCDRCRTEIEPAATAILGSRWLEREPTPDEDAAYDAAISEACRQVLEALRRDKRAVGKQTLENMARKRRERSLLTMSRA